MLLAEVVLVALIKGYARLLDLMTLTMTVVGVLNVTSVVSPVTFRTHANPLQHLAVALVEEEEIPEAEEAVGEVEKVEEGEALDVERGKENQRSPHSISNALDEP